MDHDAVCKLLLSLIDWALPPPITTSTGTTELSAGCEWKVRFEAAEEEAKTLRAKLAALEADYKLLQQSVIDAKAGLSAISQEAAALRTANIEVRSLLVRECDDKKAALHEAQSLKDKCDTLAREAAFANTRLSAANNTLEEKTSILVNVSKEHAALLAELKAVETAWDSRARVYDKVAKGWQEKFDNSESQQNELKKLIKQMTCNLENRVSELEDAHDTAVRLQAKIFRRDKKIAELQQQIRYIEAAIYLQHRQMLSDR